MPAYQVTLSAEFSERLATQPHHVALAKSLAGLIDAISESPRSRGGEYGGQWAYPLGVHLIKALIDDDKKTVALIDLFRLPC